VVPPTRDHPVRLFQLPWSSASVALTLQWVQKNSSFLMDANIAGQ
jgi:hypothetical protein